MTDEVIKQAAEAIADNTSMDNPVMNTEEAMQAAQAAYEIFRADFMRQMESESSITHAACAKYDGKLIGLGMAKAALKAVSERIK